MRIELDNVYDVNIWNEGWHNLDRGVEATKENSQWRFSFNEIIEDLASYGTGMERPELDIYITQEEADQMTLGLSEEEGGDYAPDEDFWLDSYSILHVYKNVPQRIVDYLNNLPPYEMKSVDNSY
jgi:hypothetical protein